MSCAIASLRFASSFFVFFSTQGIRQWTRHKNRVPLSRYPNISTSMLTIQ
jgi:hypothetical protein